MAQAYRVCAPYVTVRMAMAAGGETVLGFYEGGTLPEASVQESVDSLLAKGMVEETDGPTPEEQAAEDAEVEKKVAENAKKVAEEVAAEDAKKAEERAKKAEEKAAATRPDADYDEDDAPKAANRPRVNASKEEWVTYAVAQREDGTSEADARAELDGWSKNDLINEYGG